MSVNDPVINHSPASGDNILTPSQDWKLGNRICIGLVILSFLILGLFRLYFWTNHPLVTWADQSVYLEMGKLLLAGKKPYIDFFDFNPPLIMYINVIPILVSRLLHVPATEGLSLSVISFAFLSAAYSAYLAYRARAVTDFFVLLPVFFTFALYTVGLDTDLGQREHLFMLTYLPFFMVRGIRWMGGSVHPLEAVMVGLVAGVGLGLKPHFIFAAAVTELAFFYQSRQWRKFLAPENYAAAAVILAYVLHFLLLPKEALDIFFHQALPVYNGGVYWSSKCLIHMVRGAVYFIKPFENFLIAMGIACLMRNRSPWITPAVVFTCASFVNYFQGDQAWTYRLLPMAFGSYILYGLEAGILLSWFLRHFESFMAPRLILSLGLLGAVCSLAYNDIDFVRDENLNANLFDLSNLGYNGLKNSRNYLSPLFFAVLENSKPTDRVVAIGSGIEPGHPALLQSERRPGSRYLYSFQVMVEYCQDQNPSGHFFSDLARKIIDNYGADIRKYKPELVLIQDIPMKTVLEKYHFYDGYMTDYTCLGKTAEHSIWKRLGGQKNFVESSLAKRESIILSILSGQKTIDQACRETTMERAKLEDWVAKSKKALEEALTVRPADKTQELIEENQRLGDRIIELEREKNDAKLQKERQMEEKKGGDKAGTDSVK